jgi:hypothetical protein
MEAINAKNSKIETTGVVLSVNKIKNAASLFPSLEYFLN